MPDFKFSCPQCDQHIAANDSWSGRQIQCPTCQASITVPAAPGTPASGALKTVSEPPALRSSPAQSKAGQRVPRPHPQARQGAWSGLAIASFVTGLFFCSCPAAVICGHLALRKFKSNPLLKGKWMAVTGLVLGYLGVLAALVGVVGFGSMVRSVRTELQELEGFEAAQAGESWEGGLGSDEAPSSPPPEVGAISTATVGGTIDGREVTCGYATISGSQLEFKKSATVATDPWIIFFLHGMEGSPEGSSWVAPGNRSLSIHVHYQTDGGSESFVLTDNYRLRLEFGQASGGKLPGKVFLEATSPTSIRIEGSFDALLE